MDTKNIVFAVLSFCYAEYQKEKKVSFDYAHIASQMAGQLIERGVIPDKEGTTEEKEFCFRSVNAVIKGLKENGIIPKKNDVDQDPETVKYIEEEYTDETGSFLPEKALAMIKKNYPTLVAEFWAKGITKRIYQTKDDYEYFYHRIKQLHLDYYSVFEEMGMNELEADVNIGKPAYKKAMATARRVLLARAQANYSRQAMKENSLGGIKEVVRQLTQGGKDDENIDHLSHDISGNEEETVDIVSDEKGRKEHKSPEQRRKGIKLTAEKSGDNPMFVRENDSEKLEEMENQLNQNTETVD